ncbi:hypothetical protein B0T11DRAFT_283571 [Plectosphaerella cucumerina]|uniref:Uncharacterized protein n=1 Tax=Plectosphaerella cucumerina TaxID=40658 RepID=A0A8K0TAI7_9PEZI|nr:hypothetical protein B0T11DRAFT_283571 [Plectosphaerella cucumerina]
MNHLFCAQPHRYYCGLILSSEMTRRRVIAGIQQKVRSDATALGPVEAESLSFDVCRQSIRRPASELVRDMAGVFTEACKRIRQEYYPMCLSVSLCSSFFQTSTLQMPFHVSLLIRRLLEPQTGMQPLVMASWAILAVSFPLPLFRFFSPPLLMTTHGPLRPLLPLSPLRFTHPGPSSLPHHHDPLSSTRRLSVTGTFHHRLHPRPCCRRSRIIPCNTQQGHVK